jgi:hypothetical protein
VYAKVILKEPEKYFTTEFLDRIDAAAKQEFTYGSTSFIEEDEQEMEEV